MTNYDLNVWNRGAYLTEGKPAAEQYDEWMLCPYEITHVGAGYGTGEELRDKVILLTKNESEQLKLGEDGDDTFVDADTFRKQYAGRIPDRVLLWLDA
jgi:hypothetical protein